MKEACLIAAAALGTFTVILAVAFSMPVIGYYFTVWNKYWGF